MRFSDMMGSGEERSRKSPESENAISDALAPYLEAAAPETPAEPADTDEAVEVTETAVAVDTVAPQPAVPVVAPPAPTPRPHTVESVFPVVSIEPLPVAMAEPAPAEVSRPPATELADFTPLSDDLLPRRR